MTIRFLLGCALLSIPAACISDFDPATATAADTQAPSAADLAIAPELHYLGAVQLAQVSESYDSDRAITGERPQLLPNARLSQLDGGTPGRFGVMYVDFAQGAEYVASYDVAAVREAAAELARLGHADASSGTDSLGRPRGLSNDIDNRISFEDYSLTHSTLRRVGKVGGGCSGALFGNRLVLTAAHCIFDGYGDYHGNQTFQARRNGSELPFGTVTSQGAFYPVAYKNDGCNLEYTSACVKNDWAILVLPPNPWANSPSGAPGYFGVWWAGDATLATFETRNIGYPACGSTMSPPSCVSNVAYGDLSCAGVDPALSEPDARWPLYGMNGKMRTGCDTSGGHSGGPIYSYSPGDNGPYIIGNTVWNQCNSSSCGPTTQYSSAGIRISETLAEYMMNLRAQYP